MKIIVRSLLSAALLLGSIFTYETLAVAAVGDTDANFSLNGTTTAAQIADSSAIDISGAISIEAWVKPTGATSSNTYIFLNKESSYELYIANGKYIPGCRNKSTNSKSVTCTWRLYIHDPISLTASISSSTYSGYTGTAQTATNTAKRSN